MTYGIAGTKKEDSFNQNEDEQIDKLSVESYKDALTEVGNKAAYIKKVDELNLQLKEADKEMYKDKARVKEKYGIESR